jgi:hypothetical protein
VSSFAKLSQLNFRQGASLKGNQKTCDVMDKIGHYLRDGFQSHLEPITLRFFMPTMPAGMVLEYFNINFTRGAQRSLAATLIVVIAMTEGMQPTDMTDLELKIMRSLCYINVNCQPHKNTNALIRDVVIFNLRASETQRMDIMQYVRVFGLQATELINARAAGPGNIKDHKDTIQDCILAFNKETTVKNCKIDGDERLAVMNLYLFGEECQKLCADVWCSCKVRESPITVKFLAENWLQKKPPADACPMWRAMMTPQVKFLPFFFQRIITAFNAKVNQAQAQSMSTSIRLRATANKYREQINPDTLFACMCWANWQEDMRACNTPQRMADVNFMFFRGTLDDTIIKLMQQNDPEWQA